VHTLMRLRLGLIPTWIPFIFGFTDPAEIARESVTECIYRPSMVSRYKILPPLKIFPTYA